MEFCCFIFDGKVGLIPAFLNVYLFMILDVDGAEFYMDLCCTWDP